MVTFKKTPDEYLEQFEIHFGIVCEACKQKDFYGYRYKCIKCDDYDLCDDCFQTRNAAHDTGHDSSHPMLVIANAVDRQNNFELQRYFNQPDNALVKKLKDIVHTGVKCVGCNKEPIKGIRLKCDDCIEFNLCWTCYTTGKTIGSHKAKHTLIAHLWPIPKTFDPKEIEYFHSEKAAGYFGEVYKVKYRGKVCALKHINPKKEMAKLTYMNEILAFQEILCSHIVKFYGCFESRNPVELHILMEYMPDGNLEIVIRDKHDLSYRRKLQWLISIAKGLRCIHRKGFVHKDIKPDNILLNGHGGVKIGDMGTSEHIRDQEFFSEKLAPRDYSAPEISSGKFTNKVDMFSFGLVMNELLTYVPYSGKIPQVSEKSNFRLEFPVRSEVLFFLIKACVSLHPRNRPSAEEVVEELDKFEIEFWNSLKPPEEYVKLGTEDKDKMLLKFFQQKYKD